MSKKFRAYRACNVEMDKVKYPTWVMPKIDGVRGLNPYGTLLTRTLALMPNIHTRELFSVPGCQGMDGELACGLETDDDLCRKTTSGCMSVEGLPTVTWHVFDLCHPGSVDKPYRERYAMLQQWVEFNHERGDLSDVQVVPYQEVKSEEEFLYWESTWLEMGYEGIIQRDPEGIYKYGKSTAKQCGYTRRKPYEDTEGVLIDIFEAKENLNEATISAEGLTKRSSHQENKVGKGMSGALLVKRLDTGDIERIGPGKLKQAERIDLWLNRESKLAENLILKFRHFPVGVKDKARQARFLSWRDENDILPQEVDDE